MTDLELLDRYFLARILWWRQNIMQLEEATVMELMMTLSEVRRELENEFALFDWERDRLEALAAYCDDLITAASVKTTQAISQATVSAGAASLTNWATMLSVGGAAANISFVEMSPGQIKSWFQDTPLGGHSLNEWVKKAFDESLRREMLSSLRKSGVKGEGYGPMVKNLIQTSLDNGYELTERNAITIARTYTQTANVEAQRAVYEQNRDVVYAQKWVSVLDNRVCPRCAALDGVIYKNGEQRPAIPLHPRCRCLLLPCVRVDELGVTSEDLKRVARPWTIREPGNIDTGGKRKILNWGKPAEDFGGWYRTLSEAEQARIVGPVRAKLLKEGKITFGELVDKRSGRLLTLTELEKSVSLPSGKKTMDWLNGKLEDIRNGTYQPKGERQKIGYLESSIVEKLKSEDIHLDETEVTLSDNGLRHLLRDKKPNKLPDELIQNLPKLLNSPNAVYLNLHEPALVFTIEHNDIKGKLVVQLNYSIKKKIEEKGKIRRIRDTTNNLRTGAQVADRHEFANKGWYKRLK